MTSVKREIISGVAITAVSKYLNLGTILIVNAILARLLSPEEFGIVAMVTVFLTFFQLVGNSGLSEGIIQFKSLTDRDYSDLLTVSLLIAIILSTIFYGLSSIVSLFYEKDNLITIARMLSVALFFGLTSTVPLGVMRKNKKFLELGMIEVVISVLTGLVAIWLAYRGFSYYSLIIKAILSSMLLTFSALYFSKIKMHWGLNLKPMLVIYKYSSYQILFNGINYFSRNSDNIFIGKFFGSAILGNYSISYQLMIAPIQTITHVITPVLHPIFSNFQEDFQRIFKGYLKIVNILALLGTFVSVFCYFSASEIILIIFGDKWKDSIIIFRILSCSIWVQILLSSSGSIFQSIGNTRLLFVSGFLSSIVMVFAIILGVYNKSIEMLCYLLVIAFYINFVQCYYLLILRGLSSSLYIFYREIVPSFIPAIISIFLLLFLEKYISDYSNIIRAISRLVAMLTIYLIYILITGYLLGKSFFTTTLRQ